MKKSPGNQSSYLIKKNIKRLGGKHPIRPNSVDTRSNESLNKNLSDRKGYFHRSCWSSTLQGTPNSTGSYIPPSTLVDTTLLLKIPHTMDARYREIKLKLSWQLPAAAWLAECHLVQTGGG